MRSRCMRPWPDENGSMPYSLVIHPRQNSFGSLSIHRGSTSSIETAQRTFVRPNSTRTDEYGCSR